MPIVKESNPLTTAPPVPKRGADITPKVYRHAIVDSNKIPIDSLITYISGMSWVVDYYAQVLGQDEEPKEFSKEMLVAYQSYDLIKRYELKLQGDFSASFDDNQNRLTFSGSALTYPKLIPNKGDVIVGDVGDGRAGRFTVTEVSQKTIYNNTCYEIRFELAAMMDDYTEDLLASKVVNTGHFVKDFITYGQNPVLLEEDYLLKDKLEKTIKENLSRWLTEFYAYDIGTIRVPYQEGVYVYDPFVTNLITTLFTVDDHPLIGKINLYNCDAGLLRNYTSIWDAVVSGERYTLDAAFREYQLMPTHYFNRNIFLRNIANSRIDLVILPSIISGNHQDPLNVNRVGLGVAFDLRNQSADYDASPFKAEGIEIRPLNDRNYVVSDAVYSVDDSSTTELEQELRNYFQGEWVNHDIVLKHLALQKHMSKLQRFYYVPLCILLLMNTLRSL